MEPLDRRCVTVTGDEGTQRHASTALGSAGCRAHPVGWAVVAKRTTGGSLSSTLARAVQAATHVRRNAAATAD